MSQAGNQKIAVTCSGCGRTSLAPASAVGRRAKCSACGAVIEISAQAEQSQATPHIEDPSDELAKRWKAEAEASRVLQTNDPAKRRPTLLLVAALGILAVFILGYVLRRSSAPPVDGAATSRQDTTEASTDADVTLLPAKPPAELVPAQPKTAVPEVPEIPETAKRALAALQRLAAKVEVGMTQNRYVEAVGDTWAEVKPFVESADAKQFEAVKTAMDGAMQRYRAAANDWQDAIWEAKSATLKEILMRHVRTGWRDAVLHVEAAEQVIRCWHKPADVEATLEQLKHKMRANAKADADDAEAALKRAQRGAQ